LKAPVSGCLATGEPATGHWVLRCCATSRGWLRSIDRPCRGAWFLPLRVESGGRAQPRGVLHARIDRHACIGRALPWGVTEQAGSPVCSGCSFPRGHPARRRATGGTATATPGDPVRGMEKRGAQLRPALRLVRWPFARSVIGMSRPRATADVRSVLLSDRRRRRQLGDTAQGGSGYRTSQGVSNRSALVAVRPTISPSTTEIRARRVEPT
jgi:hypothetical protein